MFERSSKSALRALGNARDVARSVRATRIGPEHLLVAIANDPEADGAAVLSGLAITPAQLSADLTALSSKRSRIQYRMHTTDGTRRAMEAALDESEGLGAPRLTTAHLLLGMLASEPNKAAKILSAGGVKIDALRAAVREMPSNER